MVRRQDSISQYKISTNPKTILIYIFVIIFFKEKSWLVDSQKGDEKRPIVSLNIKHDLFHIHVHHSEYKLYIVRPIYNNYNNKNYNEFFKSAGSDRQALAFQWVNQKGVVIILLFAWLKKVLQQCMHHLIYSDNDKDILVWFKVKQIRSRWVISNSVLSVTRKLWVITLSDKVNTRKNVYAPPPHQIIRTRET